MQGSRRILAFTLLVMVPTFLVACDAGPDPATAGDATEVAAPGGTPTFRVDPTWPLEMPNKWIMGAVTAVFVDSQDHVWVTHLEDTLTPEETAVVQEPPIGTCCVPAPTVIEFSPEGEVVQAWGDPTQDISVPQGPSRDFRRSQ